MTDRELVEAARHALVNLESEQELPRNALFPRDLALSYGTLRFVVLNALESLASGGAGAAAQRRRRSHTILVRCDLNGEVHKSVIRSMALSRRQFYRERRESLVRLGESIGRLVAKAQATEGAQLATATTLDLGDAAEAYVEALRSAGQYRLVWHEATELAQRAPGDPRGVEFWLVACEAARFFADSARAAQALDAARALTQPDSYWRSLWIAASAMNLQWVGGRSDEARVTFDRAVRGGPAERSLHGKEAVLLGIMLVTAARIEVDCGHWDRARTMLARASRLAQNGTSAKRGSLLRLSALILRLSAQLALHADGDVPRSLAAFRASLDAARDSGELGNVAATAIHYSAALGDARREDALRYAGYGLEIARRFYPGDRYVELTLDAIPLMLRARGPEAASEVLSRARCSGLGARDELLLDLAQAKIDARSGDFRTATERAEAVAGRLFGSGIDAWACDAGMLAVETSLHLGDRSRARKRLAALAPALTRARAGVRARAHELESALASGFFPAG